MLKQILIFLSGAAVGAVLGIKISDMKHEEQLEREVNEKVDDFIESEKLKEEKKQAAEHEEVTKEKVNYNTLVEKNYGREKGDTNFTVTTEDNVEVDEVMDRAEYESPDDDLPPADSPYQIDEDEWEANNGYDKSELYYYKANYILINDDDQVIDQDDAEHMLGHGWQDLCEMGIVHIRNEKLRTDYEMIVNQGEYQA